MSKNYSYHSEKTKNGVTKTHDVNYSTDKGKRTSYTVSTTSNPSSYRSPVNKGKAVGAGAAIGAAILAGIKVIAALSGGQAGNKVKDLDDSFRNSGNYHG